MRLITGFHMRKYNAYSRPHTDGTCTVCDNDNPIKVMQCIFTYLARQVLFDLPTTSN